MCLPLACSLFLGSLELRLNPKILDGIGPLATVKLSFQGCLRWFQRLSLGPSLLHLLKGLWKTKNINLHIIWNETLKEFLVLIGEEKEKLIF